MKKTIARISLLVTLLAATGGGTQGAAADPGLQSASGFGQMHLGLPTRDFSFSARTSSDGTATGEAQLENRSSGFRGHIQIDCLNVIANVALMTGVWTSSTSANIPVGSDAFFAVRDNGEGPDAAADEITLTLSGLGIACTDITDPALLGPFLVTIENGQIQVRP
jgi:hypothetical protein